MAMLEILSTPKLLNLTFISKYKEVQWKFLVQTEFLGWKIWAILWRTSYTHSKGHSPGCVIPQSNLGETSKKNDPFEPFLQVKSFEDFICWENN